MIATMRPNFFDLTEFVNYLDLNNSVMVEVGSYQGESTEVFAKSGKFRLIFAVDAWIEDICSETSIEYMKEVERAFDNRIVQYPIIIKLKSLSETMAPFFANEIFDLVYLDANHNYEFIKQDIDLWLPKVKVGGYLTGHDYGGYWQGIKQAVDEKFGQPDKLFSDQSWLVRKINETN